MKKIAILYLLFSIFTIFSSYAQIKGKVVDKSNSEPLAFANIVIVQDKDSTAFVGTVTDMEGNFMLETTKENLVVKVSYLGYVTTSVTVKQNVLNTIELEEDANLLGEVVIKGTRQHFKMENGGIAMDVANSPLKNVGTANDVLEKQPFIVKTKGVSVEVLGTFFNVEAYPEDQAITTTLVEGRVNVSDGQSHYIMSPNEQVVAGGGEFVVRNVDATEVVCWIEGVCYFSEASLENIMDKLARWYDVEVFFASKSAKDAHFSLEIERYDNIATVLSKIEKTGRVKFKINGRIITVEE